jgi:hypothetical protein
VNWTSVPGFGQEGDRVKWNGTTFVATFKGGNVNYSYDGMNWNEATITIDNAASKFHGIDWNGLYWLIGTNGSTSGNVSLYQSYDSAQWTAVDSLQNVQVNSVTWTGTQWLVSGQGSGGAPDTVVSTNVYGNAWVGINGNTIPGVGPTVNTIAYNNHIYVAGGNDASTDTMAYSYDTASWTGLGTSLINSECFQIKWFANKFVAVGQTSLVYSYDGVRWTSVPGISSIFSTAVHCVENSAYGQHSITFPANATVTGNVVSRDNGSTWNNVFSSSATVVGFNGAQYIFSDSSSAVLTTDLIHYTPLQYTGDPQSINDFAWNGSHWLMCGTSSSGRHLRKSYDGFNWLNTNTSAYFDNNYPCNGAAWNGELWVVSAQKTDSSTLIYSSDGVSWSQSSLPAGGAGGGRVAWNGSYFLAGGPDSSANLIATNISISSDGQTWSTRNIGSNGPVRGLAWSGTNWVIVTAPDDPITVSGILYSSDGVTWTASASGLLYSYTGVVWNGISYVASALFGNIQYSYDGANWSSFSTTCGTNVVWTTPDQGSVHIQSPVILGGAGTYNTMAYSVDGINYVGLGKGVFSQACHAVSWNGYMWVAGGEGADNTLAYSYDGKLWHGLGTSVFSGGCYGVKSNGYTWLALGYGTNTMAVSKDGKTWTGLGASVFDASGLSADWNGDAWVAAGKGSVNTMAYSTDPDALSWTGLGNTYFDTQANVVKWMLNQWFVGGVVTSEQFLYSTSTIDGSTGYTSVTSGISLPSCNSLEWNGQVAFAAGEGDGVVHSSTDGVNWTPKSNAWSVSFDSNAATAWNGKRWILANNGTSAFEIKYSYDADTFYNSPISASMFSSVLCIGTNSGMGAFVPNNRLILDAGSKLSVYGPAVYDSGLSQDTSISFSLNVPV